MKINKQEIPNDIEEYFNNLLKNKSRIFCVKFSLLAAKLCFKYMKDHKLIELNKSCIELIQEYINSNEQEKIELILKLQKIAYSASSVCWSASTTIWTESYILFASYSACCCFEYNKSYFHKLNAYFHEN